MALRSAVLIVLLKALFSIYASEGRKLGKESLIKKFRKDNINVDVYSHKSLMSKIAAEDLRSRMKELLKEKDTVNIVLAPSASQFEFLETLMGFKDIEWERVNGFHLDEFVGLDEDNPRRLGNVAKEKIFEKASFRNVYYIDGNKMDTSLYIDVDAASLLGSEMRR